MASAVVAGVAIGTNGHLIADDKQEEPTQVDRELINKFVGKSHGDIDAVKAMLKEEPSLVKAAWDWGAGDFETGLNAASHVGRREIAELLLEKGAILDAPAAVMLGLKSVVAEMLKVYPKLHAVPGAHEIPLLSHAILGGKQAAEVFELLLDAGANVNAKSKQKMTPLMAAASKGDVSQLNTLLRYGADHHAKDCKVRTAMDMAVKRDNKACIQSLKRAQGMR